MRLLYGPDYKKCIECGKTPKIIRQQRCGHCYHAYRWDNDPEYKARIQARHWYDNHKKEARDARRKYEKSAKGAARRKANREKPELRRRKRLRDKASYLARRHGTTKQTVILTS